MIIKNKDTRQVFAHLHIPKCGGSIVTNSLCSCTNFFRKGRKHHRDTVAFSPEASQSHTKLGVKLDIEDPLVKRRSTLNPYYYNGSALVRRLLWDINPQSWISRRKLSKWKDTHIGKKAIILCNGPSLNKVNFDLIGSDIFTFGLNKINFLFDRTSFRPSCIVAVNSLVIKQNQSFYNKTEIPLFLDSIGIRKNWVKSRKKVIFMHTGGSPNGFARDCSMSITQGYTVTYVALQLAYHMGFKKVALIGADHTFATKGPPNKTVNGGTIDESHFDPRYFSNVKWHLPDLFESEVAYIRANKMYNAHDRKIYNCTEGGKLNIFRRVPLRDFLSDMSDR